MFGKNKTTEKRFVIAVKNFNETAKLLKEGNLSFPYDRSIYLKLLESQTIKVDSLKELKKFIKANNKSAGEVGHYWEGLIVDGYTLVNVEYLEKTPALGHVCSNDTFKLVCRITSYNVCYTKLLRYVNMWVKCKKRKNIFKIS